LNLQSVREAYYEASGKLSDIIRQLAFAGIAVVWLFGYLPNDQRLDDNFVLPGVLIVSCLAFDFLQYVYRSAAWGIYGLWLEQTGNGGGEFKAPGWINWPAIVLLCLKAASLAGAYALLGYRLGQRLL
jgi:hypothetical protein